MRKFKGLIFLFLTIFVSAGVFLGCSNKSSKEVPPSSKDNLPIVTIKVKNFGTMKGELYPNIAPNTVNNFIHLSNSGFYNNLTFHRVIDKFMIQGGDPDGTGMGGPSYSIKGEFSNNNFENNLNHTVGVLSMARSNNPNSAGSQFFIMDDTNKSLDGNYAAFGKITEGLDVLEKISSVKTNNLDAPINKVIIESISVDTKGVSYTEPEKI